MLMVTLGTGVGGGLVLGGKMYRGARGAAGEFGHMIVDPDGPPCSCSRNGCVESFVGEKGIVRIALDLLRTDRNSMLQAVPREKMSAREIGEAANRGDAAAIEAFRIAGHHLGIALGSVANLLNLERVVVGGGVARAGDFILDPARKAMKEIAHAVPRETIELVPAALGNEAGIAGAARLAMIGT